MWSIAVRPQVEPIGSVGMLDTMVRREWTLTWVRVAMVFGCSEDEWMLVIFIGMISIELNLEDNSRT